MTNRSLLSFLGLVIIFTLLLCSCSSLPTQSSLPPPKVIESLSTSTTRPTLTEPPAVTPPLVPTPTVDSTPLPRTYTVTSGDTLWNIAQIYGIPVGFIALQNGLTDADKIYPGQVLNIPVSAETPPDISQMGKQIVVILSLQKTYAYEDGKLIKVFLVSTGLPGSPTVLGSYTIYQKLPSTRMVGPGYDLPNVPWTMYFFEGYGLHGTYWHHNFGHPMSHGCVNMQTDDAKWLYDWAPLGTPVLILP